MLFHYGFLPGTLTQQYAPFPSGESNQYPHIDNGNSSLEEGDYACDESQERELE